MSISEQIRKNEEKIKNVIFSSPQEKFLALVENVDDEFVLALLLDELQSRIKNKTKGKL